MCEMKICYIVGASPAPLPCLTVREGDLLIAADGGYEACRAAGLVPHMLIGDMDSLDGVPSLPSVKRLPVRKDVTDLFAAILEGMERGYRTFHLYGACGGRPDHTYANYQHLYYLAKNGARGILFDGAFRVTCIADDSFTLPIPRERTFSVFAIGERARGVSISGAEYPLQSETLDPHFPLGVSNKTENDHATVSCDDGALLIFWEA